MKIELKKIKINLAFSEETTMFMAELFINDIKAGYAKNDGHGGCTDYGSYEGRRDLIEQAERYCQTLPPLKYGTLTIPMNLEHFIDELVTAELIKKEEKKIEKKCETALLFGIPNGTSYRIIDFKKPLREIITIPNGKATLQRHYNEIKAKLQPGEEIFNKNLAALGIIL